MHQHHPILLPFIQLNYKSPSETHLEKYAADAWLSQKAVLTKLAGLRSHWGNEVGQKNKKKKIYLNLEIRTLSKMQV